MSRTAHSKSAQGAGGSAFDPREVHRVFSRDFEAGPDVAHGDVLSQIEINRNIPDLEGEKPLVIEAADLAAIREIVRGASQVKRVPAAVVEEPVPAAVADKQDSAWVSTLKEIGKGLAWGAGSYLAFSTALSALVNGSIPGALILIGIGVVTGIVGYKRLKALYERYFG